MLKLNDIRESKVYQEARQEGVELVARRMLEQKVALKKIAELTGLPLEAIKRLRTANGELPIPPS